jgi:glycosyltransferase involved in cell wall biosynthesis
MAGSRVSIIIPTYNRADYLLDAVKSGLDQDYEDLEVLVSDNASTDGTEEAVRAYAEDARFRYFRNEKNLGMVGNQRKGLFEYATGDWAMVLDSDDYLIESSYIRKAMEIVEAHDKVVLVHGNFRKYNVETDTSEDVCKGLPRIVDGKWMFLNYEYGVTGTTNYDKLTTLFNREIAMELDVFDDDISSSDRDCFLRLSLQGEVGFVDEVVGVYRIHGQNLALTGGEKNFFENLRAVTNPYRYAMEEGCFDRKELERWKRRMIRDACEIHLLNRMIHGKGRIGFLTQFTRRLYSDYPFAVTVLFRLLGYKTLGRIARRGFRDTLARDRGG